jgi:phage tail-like protein
MNLIKERNPLMGFRFLVEIGGILTSGFSEVSGLQATTEVETIREGGVNDFVYKLPRSTSFGNLVLKKGMVSPASEQLWIWYRNVIAGNVIRMPIFILIQSEDETISPTSIWCAWDAFPVKWSGPTLSGNSREVAIETLEFAHHGIERV